MKKLLIFLSCYFVITMAWAYPWHLIWFHEKYAAWGAVTRDEPIILLGVAAILIQGVVIGYLYPYFKNDRDNPLLNGIKFNLIIGLMTYTAMGFATAAKIQIEPIMEFLAYHSIFQLIQFILTGTALGWIYRTKKE